MVYFNYWCILIINLRHTACKSDVSNNIVVSSGVRGNTTCDPSDSCNCDPSDTCITGINSNSNSFLHQLGVKKVMLIFFYPSLIQMFRHTACKKWCSLCCLFRQFRQSLSKSDARMAYSNDLRYSNYQKVVLLVTPQFSDTQRVLKVVLGTTPLVTPVCCY